MLFSDILFFIFFFHLDPVQLSGEGEFNLDILKEIAVTDSFLRLDQDVIECQSVGETFDNCTTNFYRNYTRIKCGCLPYSITSSSEVYLNHNFRP